MTDERLSHVVAEGLTQTFQNGGRSLTALSGLSLAVGRGEFVSIIGPSGCGKTTLLRLIGGLLTPTAGTVAIDGEAPRAAQRRKAVGYVFQDASLLPWRTVIDNICLPLEVNPGNGGNGRARELLELVRLEDFAGYYPSQLSGGMQQRVALARALALDPALLLMDEPFGALDEITREGLRYELLRVWQGADGGPRKTVLFVTHSIAEAVLLSDRVIVLSAAPGRLRASLTVDLPRPRREGIETGDAFRRRVAELRALLREPD